MLKNQNTRRLVALGMASLMVLSSAFVSDVKADAASKKAVKRVTLKIGKKKVTKKTVTLTKGKSATLKVSVSPAKAKKSVSFKSSKKSVVSVSKKGKLKAKKTGTAKITVTVKGKNKKSKKTWVKVKVKAAVKKTTTTAAKTTPTPKPTATATPAQDKDPYYTPGPTRAPSQSYTANVNPITQAKYSSGMPFYGGDPSILVDGDTVYLYVGHDIATGEAYSIIDYSVYSSKDLKNWDYHGPVFKTSDISWASDKTSAWAGQVMERHGRYYLYYCTWDRTSKGKQSIGVAVADNPTGPFKDIGKPLVKGTLTEPETSGWNDIDPTAWIETDSKGVEHRYLAWGNGKLYVCELNEDMISVKDLNGDGKITATEKDTNGDDVAVDSPLYGDIICKASPTSYTEAPWIYRRKDANGKPYGKYYLFYAYGWREQMAYTTTDDLLTGTFEPGKIIMEPAATSNTNHMAVFDFKGKTYFIYHNGMLMGGSGFRRSASIAEVHFNEDGSINYIPETAAGINGTTTTIATTAGDTLYHSHFKNSTSDKDYPYLKIAVSTTATNDTLDSQWVLVPGKADTSNAEYVSIQSENKPGLYLTANSDKTVTLAQDAVYTKGVPVSEVGKAQTFKKVAALDGTKGAYSYESVTQPGLYITAGAKGLTLTNGADTAAVSFKETSDAMNKSISAEQFNATIYKLPLADTSLN